MRRTALAATGLVGIAALLLSAPAQTQENRRQRLAVEIVNGHEVVAREALVRFRRPLQSAELAQVTAQADADLFRSVGRPGITRVHSRSIDATQLVALFANSPIVAYAEPNYVVRTLAQPNDPSFPMLWGLQNTGQAVNGGLPGTTGADIHATGAWDVSVGSVSNVVGVVDTGIDYTHVDLADNVWAAPSSFTVTVGGNAITCPAGSHGFNAITMTCDPMDDHNHGTHVSGTIGAAGNNSIGVVGVNWVGRLMGLKFLDATGSGTIADAVNAIEFAIQTKQFFAATNGANVRVLSNSWGGPDFSQALLDEINGANVNEMLFVAAAGNNGLDNDQVPLYPASYQAANVVAVAATTNADTRVYFSNYGAASVHLGAPGVDILSTIIGNNYGFLSGTSMATPHVSGAAALVLSRCALDTTGLKTTLLSSVDPVAGLAGITVSGGRLDVESAIRSCSAAPATPTGLTALGANAQVTLNWSAVKGSSSYHVKRSQTSGGPYAVLASNVTTTTYVDNSVVNDTTYFYVVSAVNLVGESGNSNEAAATPAVPPDLVISSFSVPTVGGAGLAVTVSDTTLNQGAGVAAPSTTRFYLSTSFVLGGTAVLLSGEHPVPTLQPGQSSTATVSLAIPSNTTVGLYFLFALADATHVLNEPVRSNNSSWRVIAIGPDLIVSSFGGPSSAAAGGTILVTDTVRNSGGGSADASTTRFFLSSKSLLDSTATLLPGGRAVPPLAPAGSSTGSTTLTLPAGLPPSIYYLFAKADADNAVTETYETNNTTLRSLQIGGDLIESSLTVPPKAAAGAAITVNDTTTNQGAGPVAASVTRFYFSPRAIVDSNAVLLPASRSVPALAAGTSSSGSTTLTVPPTTTPGTYYIIAVANADLSAAESQTANNWTSRSLAVGPDLIVSNMSVPLSAVAGTTVSVTSVVTNQGADTAGASTIQFYLSTKFLLDGSAVPIGSDAVPPLAAGASHSGSTSVTIPAGMTPGSYFLLALADAGNAVAESQEGNNTSWRLIQVTAP
jgi:subtilisin family serine protease